MNIIKTSKQIREGQHIYGNLPNSWKPNDIQMFIIICVLIILFIGGILCELV